MALLFLIVLMIALMIPLTAVILDSQVGRAIAGRLEKEREIGDVAGTRRLAALESEVERLAREVQRLDEESTFLHRLLEGKTPPEQLPPGESNS